MNQLRFWKTISNDFPWRRGKGRRVLEVYIYIISITAIVLRETVSQQFYASAIAELFVQDSIKLAADIPQQ